jgi:GGDEF domain-containing protein
VPIFEAEINGEVFEVEAPDEASAISAIQGSAPSEYASPAEGMGMGERISAGAGKAVYDVGRGIGQLMGNVPQEEIDAARQRDAALMATGGGMAGNVLGNVAMSAIPGRAMMGIPGLATAGRALAAPSTLGQAAAGGAMFGVVQPTATGESRISNIAMGAGGGSAGYGAMAGLGRVMAPQTPEAVRDLMARGVTPTPGQILGPTASRIEQGLSSIPVVGDVIRNAQISSIEQFNKAVGNEVLSSVGKRVPSNIKPGNEMIRYVGDEVSKEYNTLLPKLSARIDDQFTAEISRIREMGQYLPPDKAKQLNKIINDKVVGKIGSSAGIKGETIKEMQSSLGNLAKQYKTTADADQRQVGNAIGEIMSSLRSLVSRNNPEYAKELTRIDTAWAKLATLEKAAGRVGSQEGIFSPEQFRGAVKASDRSARDRAFARGQALMQPLAQSGVNVLGKTVPDSGTPYRVGSAALGGGLATGALSGAIDPGMIASILGTGAVYGTDIGRRAAAAALTQRPEAIQALGRGVYGLAPSAGLLGSGMSQ